MKISEYNEMMAYMLRPATGDRKNFAIGGGVVEGQDLGSREGFVQPKLIIGGSRTPSEFRNKFGVRTSLTVPEDTPGYLGRTGEQVVFETEADAQRFADEDIKKLNKIAQESKKRSPVIEARLQKIKDFVKSEKTAGKKKIYLDDIIEHLEGEKTVFGTGKRGIQTEQTKLKSRVSLRENVREALGDTEYDKLEKGPGGDRRIADQRKGKFNKLVQDVNRGDLPITELGSEARGTTQNIKQYLTEINKKRFDKLLPALRAINSRISQPAETLTSEGIDELKKTTVKTFNAAMKKFPSSIERRTQVFKGGTRFYNNKSFALAQIGRHVAQGGTLYKHVGGNTMKDVKFRNTKTGKLITIRNIDMNSSEFKEADKAYKDFEKLKNTKIDNPLDPNKKISINEAIKQGSNGKDYLVVDHVDGIKNNPLKNLIVTSQKQNIGFQLANLTEDQKKLFYRNRLSLDDNIKRFSSYGQRLLGGSKYKTPTQTASEFVSPKQTKIDELTKIDDVTTADKIDRPDFAKEKTMFDNFGSRTSANPFFDPQVLKQGALDTLKVLGTPTVAAGFAGSTIKKNLDEGQNLLDAATDKMVGIDLLYPEVAKQTVGRFAKPAGQGILSTLGRVAMNPFGRAARAFTPVGAGITAIGVGKDYYDFAKDEIAKVKEMTPEERGFYNDLLMDEGGLLD